MNEKKKAAAIAAVIDYIKTEEEAIMMQSAQIPPGPEKAVSTPPAGRRQDLMQMRNLMQMKAFHGIR
jgi:hypothetical protein